MSSDFYMTQIIIGSQECPPVWITAGTWGDGESIQIP